MLISNHPAASQGQSLDRRSQRLDREEASQDVIRDMLPAVGGLVLGGGAAYLGAQLGDDLARYALRQGPRWVLNGWVSPRTALEVLPYVRDQAFMGRAAALTLGLAGFVAGAYLLYSLDRTP
jgi:hypothetical protein